MYYMYRFCFVYDDIWYTCIIIIYVSMYYMYNDNFLLFPLHEVRTNTYCFLVMILMYYKTFPRVEWIIFSLNNGIQCLNF